MNLRSALAFLGLATAFDSSASVGARRPRLDDAQIRKAAIRDANEPTPRGRCRNHHGRCTSCRGTLSTWNGVLFCMRRSCRAFNVRPGKVHGKIQA